MGLAKLQMLAFSGFAAVVALAGLAYIFIDAPPYLRATREGVPYFTPPVANPLNGKPLDLNMLARHYEGKDAK